MVEDYGDLVEMTRGYHVDAFDVARGAIGLMAISGPSALVGGGSPGSGQSTGPGSGTVAPGPASGTLGVGAESPGGAPTVGTGTIPTGAGGVRGVGAASVVGPSGGRLPFTGLKLAAEGLVGLAMISGGLALRRVLRATGRS